MPDGQSTPRETHNCGQKTSDPIHFEKPARQLVEYTDPLPLESPGGRSHPLTSRCRL